MDSPVTTTNDSKEGLEPDELFLRLRREAEDALAEEPELKTLFHRTVLAPGVSTFEDAVAATVCYRLLLHPCSNEKNAGGPAPIFCPNSLRSILADAMKSEDHLEAGHTMSHAIRQDALAACRRDPACETIMEVVMFYKGYAALVCHRAARQKWKSSPRGRSVTALFLQSQASAVFGLDIHPAATIGAGVLFDHGTGIVIGETAHVGDGCTFLHGVTLGGTGKTDGDRHPKIGKNVLIGAGASILGNIKIGDASKIGAGSIVLRPIPAGATAVGAPAKIIGRALELNPGEDIDDTLQNVGILHKSASSATVMTASSSITLDAMSLSDHTSANFETNRDGNTKARTLSSAVNEIDCPMCPFREYKRLAKGAPPGTITIYTMFRLLLPTGCTIEEIGAAFLQLDDKFVGYVHQDCFKRNFADVVSRCIPQIPSGGVQALLLEFHQDEPPAKMRNVGMAPVHVK